VKKKTVLFTILIIALSTHAAMADLIEKTYLVGNTTRHVLLHEGRPSADGRPLVLVFHGYGGTHRSAARAFQIETVWPDAMVAYIQGLVIPSDRKDGRIDPGQERPGWQRKTAQDGGRDLQMVDVLLERLTAEYQVDRRRIYATGFSNGGLFTWVLVGARPDTFAAYAPVGAVDNGNLVDVTKPKPVIYHFGEKDKAFKLAWANKSIRRIKALNRSREPGVTWGPGYTLFEPEDGGAPFVLNLHPRGHEVPEYAPKAIVRFFKSQLLVRP